MLTTLYRKTVPQKARDLIYKAFLGEFLVFFRPFRAWVKTFASRGESRREERRAFRTLWTAGRRTAYPWVWRREYENAEYPVMTDEGNGLPYVLHHGKRLYFRRPSSLAAGTGEIRTAYEHLLIEQDARSAHRYVRSYDDLAGRTLLDIGAAEGIFTLDCIESVRRACLFECDEEWIEAIEATFAPWRHKVEIVRKRISDTDCGDEITLDSFMEGRDCAGLFVKMDIEGYEQRAIVGARNLLRRAPDIAGSVAVYHTREGEREVRGALEAAGFATETAPGFLYFDYELRRGVVRFARQPRR